MVAGHLRAGNWGGWATLGQKSDPHVLKQVGPTCGHCAVLTILRQEGVDSDFERIVSHIGHRGESTALELTRALGRLHPRKKWVAANKDFPDDAAARAFALKHPYLWIAMMWRFGRGGHWLGVRGNPRNRTIFFWDSWDGTHGEMAWDEFERDWNRIAVHRR